MDNIIKGNIQIKNVSGINYLIKNGKRVIFKKWLGDLFSPLYDRIMKKNVFPKKFNGDIQKHEEFLKSIYKDIVNEKILEISTGTGNLANLISNNNEYYGIDISPGLLKKAINKFSENNFKEFNLYLCSVDNMIFKNNSFDVCICNLSLNFFSDIQKVIKDINDNLKVEGYFFASVPVIDRIKGDSFIHGNIFTEDQLKIFFESNGFEFKTFDFKNGALLYFKAIKE